MKKGPAMGEIDKEKASKALLSAVKDFWPRTGAHDTAMVVFQMHQLLAAGADPNAAEADGSSLAHFAAFKDAVPFLETLLAAGADLESEDQEGARPSHRAIMGASPEALRFLLAAGADPNARWASKDATLLSLAAMTTHYSMCEELLRAGAGFEPNLRGATPLHIVAARGTPRLARLLIEGGADPLARDREGKTPADYARIAGMDDYMTRLLLTAEREALARREARELDESAASTGERRPAARI